MPDTMTNSAQAAYDEFHPGDLIAAERINAVQVAIKKDIRDQVEAVQTDLDEFKATPVDASKFGGKTPEEWTKTYDERYVQRSELKNGWGEYRRYFKQLDRQLDRNENSFGPALIEHKLGRYPIVSLFELDPLTNNAEILSTDTSTEAKFVVYYAGRRDPAANVFHTRGLDITFWGDPLELILQQFGMSITETQLFDDVLNDLWGHMFDPGLDQNNFRAAAYGHSRYIQEQVLNNRLSVQQLKADGIWKDLRVAIRPQMIPAVAGPINADNRGGEGVQMFHLSQNTIELRSTDAIDLMVVLRT